MSHPDHIGPYRLLRVLGEGGMGIVYEAEQRVTVRRKVAVKVMKPGLDTKEVVARFEAERQALAVMEHPGIAKVLDAGATDEGRPYFVMELVHGEPLRDYADRRKLSVQERLELFVKVCHAVQHAHLKGVIHRDLKPSNILVEERDGVAEPRVIDFGIAKATGRRLTEATLVTDFGQAVGTPAYMSPEQADTSGIDVDTRTDVYSLGVTLYELLVDRLPIDPAEVGQQGFMAQLLLRETDPPTPSTRFRTLAGEYRDAVARFRRTDPSSLRKELSGDLDAIVMKAVEKDRNRRYDTANALALDVQRHLSHEPVLASAPSVAYRVAKFVRRHRVGVAAAAAVALALIAGSVLATAGMIRAQKAERDAEAFADFMEKVFRSSDPFATRGGVSARELLDRGAEMTRDSLEGRPEVQARLLKVIGNTYGNLGLYDAATQTLEGSLALSEGLHGRQDPGVAEILNDLAVVDWQRGEYPRAAQYLREALAIREAALGPADTLVASTLDDLAVVCGRLDECTEAEALFQEALAIREKVLGPDHVDVATSLNNLGAYYGRRREFGKAEPVLQRALAIWESNRGPDHLKVADALNNLGTNYVDQGRPAEAEPLLERALAIREDQLPPDHPLVATSLNNLATFYYKTDKVADAAPLFQRALAIWEIRLGPDHSDLQAVLSNLGRTYWKLGRLSEAEPLTSRALAILERQDHPQPWDLGLELLNLADIYRDQGRYREAGPLYRRAVALIRDSLPGDPLLTDALASYAASLRLEGRAAAADSVDALAEAFSASQEQARDGQP